MVFVLVDCLGMLGIHSAKMVCHGSDIDLVSGCELGDTSKHVCYKQDKGHFQVVPWQHLACLLETVVV